MNNEIIEQDFTKFKYRVENLIQPINKDCVYMRFCLSQNIEYVKTFDNSDELSESSDDNKNQIDEASLIIEDSKSSFTNTIKGSNMNMLKVDNSKDEKLTGSDLKNTGNEDRDKAKNVQSKFKSDKSIKKDETND